LRDLLPALGCPWPPVGRGRSGRGRPGRLCRRQPAAVIRICRRAGARRASGHRTFSREDGWLPRYDVDHDSWHCPDDGAPPAPLDITEL